MRNINLFFRRFVQDDRGTSAIEYALMATLISLAIVTTAGTAGTTLSGVFTTIGNKL